MTSASAYQLPFKNIAVGLAGLLLALSCFFAAAPAAHANTTSLSEPQIQAVLGLLSAFNVDPTIINNVNAILHGTTGSCTYNCGSPVPGSPTLSATPTSGQAPLAVTFSVTNMGSGSYTLDYGDGKSDGPLIGECPAGSSSCNYRGMHTYTSAGSYTAQLLSGCAPSQPACPTHLIGTVTLTVTGTQSAATLQAYPTSGQAPLAVTFRFSPVGQNDVYNYRLDFGDGQTGSPYPSCIPTGGQCMSVGEASHTYSSTGTYTSQLIKKGFCPGGAIGACQADQVAGTATVTVTNGQAQSVTFSASPTYGQAPLAVQFLARGTSPSATYSVDFGDGASGQMQSNCFFGLGGCELSFVSNHTYASAGTYTAKLYQDDNRGSCNPSYPYCGSAPLGTATVTVTGGSANNAPTATLTQSASQTTSDGTTGQPFTVSWSSTNATSCVLQRVRFDGYGQGSTWNTGTSGSVQATANVVGSYHFSIDCTGPGGSVHQDMYHTVVSSNGGSGTSASCTWNGQTMAHGSSVVAYQSPSASGGSSTTGGTQCISESRICNNGSLSGSYQYASCSVSGGGTTGGCSTGSFWCSAGAYGYCAANGSYCNPYTF